MAVIDAPNMPQLRFESSLFHFSPHSAFDDPSCPAGAAPRASIEIRAFAFWG
jgi:hypothetical protein